MSILVNNLNNFLSRKHYLFFSIAILAGSLTGVAIAADTITDNIVQIQNDGTTGYTITVQMPELNLLPVRLQDHNYTQIETRTEGIAGEPGLSAIPSFSRWIEIPAGNRPVINFSTGAESIIIDIEIAPFPLLSDDNPNIESPLRHTVELEAKDVYYPPEAASVSEPILIGTKYMALVDIFPFQYNTADKQLRMYENIEVNISFQVDLNRNDDKDRRTAPVYRELDRALDESPPTRDDFAARQNYLGHYVFVARDEDVIEILEPLIEWKRKKGFIVTVANMEDIGNRRDEIKMYLQAAWDGWAIPPNFVVLAGDVDGEMIVPCFTAQPMTSWHASDNQYVNWRGGDPYGNWIPEGFIGRLPAAEARHLEAMVAKLVGYESDPYIEEPWVEGGVMIANGVQSCIANNIAVREMMVNYGYSPNRITEAYADYHQNQRPDINRILSGINRGVGFINFRGYNNWGDFYPAHINQLRNGWMLPVVCGMVCGTNDFRNFFNDQRPECRGETFLRAWSGDTPKGGIACYGPSDLYTHTWFNNIVDAEFFNVMFNKDIRTLGVLCLAAKMALLRNLPSFRSLGDGHTVGYYFFTYNLLGDPGMQVWTRDPMSIEVEFEAELPLGSTLIHAAISAEDEERELPPVYAHIYAESDDDEIRYGGYTDQNGEITLNVEPLPAGEYYLTFTGDNIVPVLESFTVEIPSIYTSITEVTYSDDNEGESRGNNDADFNPGETIEIFIELTNTGNQDSEEFSGILRSTSPYIEIEREEVDWDGINAGESAVNGQPFLISLAIETPNEAKIDFVLTTQNDEVEMEGGFQQTVYGYNFSLRRYSFIGEDVELLPGSEEQLLITLLNRGTFDSNPIGAVLHCNDPKIQIRRAELFLGEILEGEEANNEESPFLIFAAPDLSSSSVISFGLMISDEEGRQDSLEFEITMGGNVETAPQGPTEYGYWAYDSRDTTANMNPEYDWVAGRENLRLRDYNDAPTPSGVGGSNEVIELPFEFTYFGEQFTEITIGSNGWLCFGRTDHIGWNNQEIGSGLAPPSMLCPYWTDLWDGDVFTLNDVDNGRFIIEWREFQAYEENYDHTFAVHLYQRDARLTVTGDCEFEFLYEDYRRNLGPGRDIEQEDVTIGFGSPDRRDRMTIAHADRWDPRTEGLLDYEDGMAIRFTTGIMTEMGGVQGSVTAVEDGSPVENVSVMLDGTGFFDNTDEDGQFYIERAPVGNYSVVAKKRYYNDDMEADIQIVEDEISEVDFQLTYPTFNIDTEEIRITVEPGDSDSTEFQVWNEGNGPLDYSFKLNYTAERPGERDQPWDLIFNLAVGDSVEDTFLYGVTFGTELFYITGMFERNQLPHKIYLIDKAGNFVGDIDQHTVDSLSARGYKEIEFKGDNLLAIEDGIIIELTTEGEAVDTIPAPYNPTQCLAWSPERETIFAKSTTGRQVIEIDIDGNEVNFFPIEGENIRSYGMAWFPEDEDGFNLYIFGRYTQAVDNSHLLLFKMNPESGEFRLVRVFQYEGLNETIKPLGCTITKAHNPLIWTFIGLVSGAPFDRLIGWELGPNLSWISYEPESGQVPPGETQPFKLTFYTEDMPEQEYYVVLELYHNAVGDMQEIPIYFNIGEVSVNDRNRQTVDEFTLDGAFPNPFNPTTTISFNLPESAEVTIGIYSVEGRLVERFEPGRLNAGMQYYQLNGAELSSGIYLVRVTANARTATQKLVLMR